MIALAGLLAAALFVYLLYALIKPNAFDLHVSAAIYFFAQ
jgi:K+-transporting ATPase KdpF subunit